MNDLVASSSDGKGSLNDEEKLDIIRPRKSLRKDLWNILFLMFLYFLQGIPTGFLLSIQFILSSRNASYTDQGTFTLSHWPFTIKLLWAPFVDAWYSNRIGRRKSWLVPVQILIGALLIGFAPYIQRVLGDGNTGINIHDEIYYITGIFTFFIFLAATQDIAVDGWAITILSKENIEWASICNNAGATIGMLTGQSLFLVLNSADFCNNYIRSIFGYEHQVYGLVSLKEFMTIFGVIFIISTTIILFFKNEKNDSYYVNINEDLSICATFKSLVDILKLKPIQLLITFLLTWKVAFALEKMNQVKLIESGVTKESLGLMTVPFQLVQIIVPILIGNFFLIKKPLSLFFKNYPVRMLMGGLIAIWIYVSPWFKNSDGKVSISYILIYALINGLYLLLSSILDMSKVYFFAQISDKTIGGTYMTLLNTFSNFGFYWPMTLAFYLVDLFSVKECVKNKPTNTTIMIENTVFSNVSTVLANNNKCSTDNNKCTEANSSCIVTFDSFYVLSFVFLAFGVIWCLVYKRVLRYLQSLPFSKWTVNHSFCKSEIQIRL